MGSRTKFIPSIRRQRGDTLVEVLIAVAIISSVLTGAFIVSQKSTTAVRSSQEQGEMLQILQGQVEAVRALALKAPNMTSGIYDASSYFCIDTRIGGTQYTRINNGMTSLPPIDSDNFKPADYADACRSVQKLYNLTIKYDPSAKVFNFYGRWDGLGGNKKQEQLTYRIYPSK